jgi:hypothetical protein
MDGSSSGVWLKLSLSVCGVEPLSAPPQISSVLTVKGAWCGLERRERRPVRDVTSE